MRVLDWVVLLGALLLPSLLLAAHGEALLRRRVPAARMAGVILAYQVSPWLGFLGLILAGTGERLAQTTHYSGAWLVTILVPTLSTLACLYPGFRMDRPSRPAPWTFREYLKTVGPSVLAPSAFLVPFLIVIPLLPPLFHVSPGLGHILADTAWAGVAGALLLLGVGGLLAWLIVRWSKRT